MARFAHSNVELAYLLLQESREANQAPGSSNTRDTKQAATERASTARPCSAI